MPITWRNVNGETGARDAALAYQGANKSITQGLDALGSVLKDQQDLQEANRLNERERNTSQFLDKLASFGSSEELQAAIDSGELDTLRADLGPNVDQDALRGADTAALDKLYQREAAAVQREEAEIGRQVNPVVDQLRGLIADGDIEGAESLREQNKDLLTSGNMYGAISRDMDTQERELLDRKYQDFKRKRETSTIRAEDQMQEIIADAVELGGGSSSEAFGLALAFADQAGIPARVKNKALQEVESAWATSYGLTASQAEEHNIFVANQGAQLESITEAANARYEEIAKVAAIDPTSIYGKPETASYGKAIEKLGALGYDDDYNSSRLTQAVEEVLDEGNYGTLSAEDPAMMAVAMQAVDRLGEAKDVFPGEDNVDVSDLKKYMRRELIALGKYREKEAAILQAARERDMAIAEARKQTTEAITTNRDSYINLRRLLSGS